MKRLRLPRKESKNETLTEMWGFVVFILNEGFNKKIFTGTGTTIKSR